MNALELEKDILFFLKNNRRSKFDEKYVFTTLETLKNNFSIIFYLFSESNRVLNAENFRQSFLYKNLENFSEEELYYITEGLKNQIILEFTDFYIVNHLFFTIKLLKMHPIRNLLLFTLQNFDYKMREFLISTEILKKMFEDENKVFEDLFYFKLLKILIESTDKTVIAHLKDLNLKINIKNGEGVKRFLKLLYEELEEDKRYINIVFV